MATTKSEELKVEELKAVYEQICNAHNGIADFRAKLLALLPIASGAGIFLLLSKDLDPKVMPHLFAVGIFGAAVTVGLFVYELVGIHRCQTLRKKGQVLEEGLLPGSKLGRFTPSSEKYYRFVRVSVASLIVYSWVIGAWTYVACIGTEFWPGAPPAPITPSLATQEQLEQASAPITPSLITQEQLEQALITSALVILAVIILGTIIRWRQKEQLKRLTLPCFDRNSKQSPGGTSHVNVDSETL